MIRAKRIHKGSNHRFFYNNRKFLRISYYIKMLRRIRKLPLASLRRKSTEARKGSYSYESAPRERVRKRTLCYIFGNKWLTDRNGNDNITDGL